MTVTYNGLMIWTRPAVVYALPNRLAVSVAESTVGISLYNLRLQRKAVLRQKDFTNVSSSEAIMLRNCVSLFIRYKA